MTFLVPQNLMLLRKSKVPLFYCHVRVSTDAGRKKKERSSPCEWPQILLLLGEAESIKEWKLKLNRKGGKQTCSVQSKK